MGLAEQIWESEDWHPIDLVERLAELRTWEFERVGEDQISVIVEGLWRNYGVSLSWAEQEQILQLLCCFDMQPPKGRESELYKVLNLANEKCWTGAFSYWEEDQSMVYRYGLILARDISPSFRQIERVIGDSIRCCEQFFPAFQLVCWGQNPAHSAMEIAMTKAYGHA